MPEVIKRHQGGNFNIFIRLVLSGRIVNISFSKVPDTLRLIILVLRRVHARKYNQNADTRKRKLIIYNLWQHKVINCHSGDYWRCGPVI